MFPGNSINEHCHQVLNWDHNRGITALDTLKTQWIFNFVEQILSQNYIYLSIPKVHLKVLLQMSSLDNSMWTNIFSVNVVIYNIFIITINVVITR